MDKRRQGDHTVKPFYTGNCWDQRKCLVQPCLLRFRKKLNQKPFSGLERIPIYQGPIQRGSTAIRIQLPLTFFQKHYMKAFVNLTAFPRNTFHTNSTTVIVNLFSNVSLQIIHSQTQLIIKSTTTCYNHNYFT